MVTGCSLCSSARVFPLYREQAYPYTYPYMQAILIPIRIYKLSLHLIRCIFPSRPSTLSVSYPLTSTTQPSAEIRARARSLQWATGAPAASCSMPSRHSQTATAPMQAWQQRLKAAQRWRPLQQKSIVSAWNEQRF